MVDSSLLISLVLAMTSEAPPTSFSVVPVPSPKSSRQSSKRKAETDSQEGAFQTHVLPPVECINIRFHRDELDPAVLEKLPASAAIAVASVHKYWTSAFGKAADKAELAELLKLAEMYTSRSHAQKKAESQLRSCQDMVHAKDKELTEALNELSRAHDLLIKLRVPGYVNPKSPTGT
ncbi:hypothetical protein Fot_37371 [Forsythia ovata]|uniref:Uncharacterized protein n=1 Tax=Forsythia ovata TaxID=205694 RepID=A0ABD1S2Y4_9LAMI